MLNDDLNKIEEDEEENGIERIGHFTIHLINGYKFSKEDYNTILGDGLCWLRTYFHNAFNRDADLSKSNDRIDFSAYHRR